MPARPEDKIVKGVAYRSSDGQFFTSHEEALRRERALMCQEMADEMKLLLERAHSANLAPGYALAEYLIKNKVRLMTLLTQVG